MLTSLTVCTVSKDRTDGQSVSNFNLFCNKEKKEIIFPFSSFSSSLSKSAKFSFKLKVTATLSASGVAIYDKKLKFKLVLHLN